MLYYQFYLFGTQRIHVIVEIQSGCRISASGACYGIEIGYGYRCDARLVRI
jgi:hypothetical protein